MHTSRVVSLFVLCMVFLAAGLGALVVAQEQEAEPPAEEARQVEVPEPLVIPEEEKNRKNPIEDAAESITMGRQLFSSQCVMCHGKEGDGTGDLAEEVGFDVPDFTDPEVQEKRTDGELYYILTRGHGEMPGQGERLRPIQKWHLVNFIRTLGEESAKESPARE